MSMKRERLEFSADWKPAQESELTAREAPGRVIDPGEATDMLRELRLSDFAALVREG